MKKVAPIVLAVLLLSSLSFSLPIEDNESPKPNASVKESRMNVFVDLGLATGDFKGFLIGFGFQYGFTPDLFGEIEADVNVNPIKSSVTNTAFGVSMNGVYKIKMSNETKMFVKAGFSSTSLTASYGNVTLESDSQIGLNAGAGMEFALGKKIGARIGSTFKIIFDPIENLSYVKFYGGMYYAF